MPLFQPKKKPKIPISPYDEIAKLSPYAWNVLQQYKIKPAWGVSVQKPTQRDDIGSQRQALQARLAEIATQRQPKPTVTPPTPVGQTDLVMTGSPNTYLNPKTGKWYSVDDRGIMEISPEFAYQLINEYNKPSREPGDRELALEQSKRESMRLEDILSPKLPSWQVPLSGIARANLYESARQSILSTLTSPADWITRWQVSNSANPYKNTQQISSQEELSNNLDRVRTEKQYWGNLLENPNPEVSTVAKTGYEYALENEQKFQEQLDTMGGQGGGTPDEGNLPSAYPSAPSWLSKFVPGQKEGQTITREFIPTPSGQLLNKSPWSVLEGMSGYAEFVGGRPWRDILESAAMMQPETPVGAGRPRWIPAYSKVGR